MATGRVKESVKVSERERERAYAREREFMRERERSNRIKYSQRNYFFDLHHSLCRFTSMHINYTFYTRYISCFIPDISTVLYKIYQQLYTTQT